MRGEKLRERKSYSKIKKIFDRLGVPHVEIPNLLKMQIDAYDEFLQRDVNPKMRENKGLQEVFNNIFPIEDQKGIYTLEFNSYSILQEKYNIDECIERSMTYQAPIKANFRLTVFEKEDMDHGTGKKIKNTLESDVFLGEVPLITDRGTFIINGAERVIISQLHRSPGVFYSSEIHSSGQELFTATVIPYQGTWMEFTTNIRNVISVYIDKRRKLPVTTLLKAIGIPTNEELRKIFYKWEEVNLKTCINSLQENKYYAYEDIYDKETGEVIVGAGARLTESIIRNLIDIGIIQVKVIARECEAERELLESTISKDSTENELEAMKKVYTLIRPGEEPSEEAARELVKRIFFNEKRYNLGKVGRYKINERLGLQVPMETKTLVKEDYIGIVKGLIDLYKGENYIDDIDHLGNRRVRSIGELLSTQFAIGLSRLARIVRERMALSSPEDITIPNLISSNAVISAVHSFFSTGQLSQFMEQSNPLSEITHKRRFSALGHGGLTRERAGFEVRDVHYSHYGRICPIETPEGPNIGLLTSPALFTRINEYGFLETPYIKVENGKVTNKIEYMAAYQEEEKHIAQANIDLDKNLTIKDDFIFVRYRDDFIQVPKEQVEYIDVSAQQIISVSAALIPFLEHDDANRALMGSNMMRQAVPLLKPEPPIVGTGLEKIVAEDSGMVHKAPFDGKVTKVTSDKIVISRDKSKKKDKINLEDEVEIQLKKFHRTNQDTCINQHPCVSLGMNVKKGQILTDGPGISDGELALGRNLLVAFMPWYGYNYEDAVIISQRIAREDILTSIYIEKHEVLVRVVKNGNEELTSEIPNVPKSSLRNLDKNGIIKVGSYVKPGDVLVGKITPKIVNVDPSPEEKLMRALFGERAGDFTDSSLKASPGMEGVVVDVKLFSRCQEDFGSPAERKQKEKRLKKDFENRNKKIDSFLASELEKYLYGQVADSIIDNRTNEYYIKHGEKITKKLLRDKVKFNRLNLDVDLVKDAKINQLIYNNVIQEVKKAREINNNHYKKERDRLHHGDELPQGVRKMVKVFIAKKRKVEVGDKLSGRHGNKGVISKIVPIEDMPFLEDGTPIDIILNPLGVPSRMNIGQILETHLGWAAKELNMKVETPPFDGAKISDITKEMLNANLPIDGKVILYDGKTGEPFGEKITIGYIYMMKLYHLVADKMHARSTGPYSLVSQQPLGGKAQHGGQRLGEMEVWALEAYGASRLLQEMLTVKSDDVEGRNKTYEAITKGENPPEPGTPESFNVLINELQSLCLDITMLTEEE